MSETTKKGASAKRTPPSTYDRLKARYPETILLMSVGDNFEAYDNDARLLNKITGLTLRELGLFDESESESAPLFAEHGGRLTCGFPATQLDTYVPKLVRAGFKVAVCEQLDKARPGSKQSGHTLQAQR